MDKVAVFLDGGYISNLTKYVFTEAKGKPKKIDFSAFAAKLAQELGGEIFRAYYYHCPPYQSEYPNEDERRRKSSYDKFNYALQRLRRFQVREGRLRKTYDEKGAPDFIQKGVDVLLAVDMVKLAMKGAITKAVIVSGDSDFVPAVRAIKEEGLEVHLFYNESNKPGEKGYSDFLFQECDERHVLNKEHFDC